MARCCICGRILPNRFAIAGKCAQDGCEALFCALHWHNGNNRCKEHGWKAGGILTRTESSVEDAEEVKKEPIPIYDGETKETEDMDENSEEKENIGAENPHTQDAKADMSKLSAEQGRKILASVAGFASKLGVGAVQYVQKLRHAKTPEGALESIDGQLKENKERRAPIIARSEALYGEIVAKKKLYQSAPPARKKILEMELKSMLSEYKALERQLTAFFENENTLNVVRGRLVELTAMGLRKVKEADIDKLTDDIEDAFEDADGVNDALTDLDKAGARKERDSDKEAFADALAGFADDLSDGVESDAASDPFEITPPVSAVAEKPSQSVAEEE